SGAARAEPAASAQRYPYAWTEPTPPFKIIDNIYWVGTEGLASFLITTPAGDFLIDGGVPGNAPRIEKSVQALGFNLTDVKILLNTHAHFDHSGGLAQLKHDTGAPLYASAGDVSALESGSYLGSENDHKLDSVPVKVDRTLHDGEELTLGGVTLR